MKKGILLHTDEKRIKQIRKDAIDSANELNNLIVKLEKICKTNFNKEQRDNIRDNGFKAIQNIYKPSFNFPAADDNFNYKALGISLDDISGCFIHYGTWVDYPIEQDKNGIFEVVGEPEQLNSCYTYTQNDTQVEAYNMAVQITDLINAAIEKGFIHERQAFKFIAIGGILDSNQEQTRVAINTKSISRLKSQ